MPHIFYHTLFARNTLLELKQKAAQGNPEAAIELILRSPFSGHISANLATVSSEEAIKIARESLKKHPEHPIFNYVLGCSLYKDNSKEAIKYLQLANRREDLFKGRVAFMLTYCHYNLEEYTKAGTWLIPAFQDEEGQEVFLKGRFTIPSDSINKDDKAQMQNLLDSIIACTLLGFVVSGKKIPYLEYSYLISKIRSPFKEYFVDVNNSLNVLADLENSQSATTKLLTHIMGLRPLVVLEFFMFAQQEKIIDELSCVKILDYYQNQIKFPILKDNANYHLFLTCLKKQDFAGAMRRFYQLSKNFNQFKITDFASLEDTKKDFFYNLILKHLIATKNYDKAFLFLSNITDPNYYSKEVLSIFTLPQFNENFDLFLLKKKLLERAISSIQLIEHEPLALFLKTEFKKMVTPAFWTQKVIQCVLSLLDAYIHDRENKAKKQLRYMVGDYLNQDGKKRSTYVGSLREMFKESAPSSVYAAENCLKNFLSALAQGEDLFSGQDMPIVFKRAKSLIDEAIIQLKIANDIAAKLTVSPVITQPALATGVALKNPQTLYPTVETTVLTPKPFPSSFMQKQPNPYPVLETFSLYPQIYKLPNGEVQFSLPVRPLPEIPKEIHTSAIGEAKDNVVVENVTPNSWQQSNDNPFQITEAIIKDGGLSANDDLIDLTEENTKATEISAPDDVSLVQGEPIKESQEISFPAIPKDDPVSTMPSLFFKKKPNEKEENTKVDKKMERNMMLA